MANSSPTIEIIRGDDINLNLTFKDQDGTAINITGFKVYFTVKRRLGDGDSAALLSADVTSHTQPVLGKTIVLLAHSNTDDISEGTYYYDLQLKDTGGNISSTKRGVFNVVEDVTKRIS